MITEDYVSFETAKLLKERGFNEIKCNTCYKWNGNFCNNRRSMSGVDNEICYQAPTLQMAMKWLREAHNITIGITFSYGIVSYEIQKNEESITSVDSSRTYEQMVEEAINIALKIWFNYGIRLKEFNEK